MKFGYWGNVMICSAISILLWVSCRSKVVDPAVLMEPSSIAVMSGNNQFADLEGNLKDSLKVIVKDINGKGVSGIKVHFTVREPNGGSIDSVAFTDVKGIACALWKTSSIISSYHAEAKVLYNGVNIIGSPLVFIATRNLQVGDEYQGGLLAYILQSGDPGFVQGEIHGLIATSADQSSGASWCNGCVWSNSTGMTGATSIGATGSGLGTGADNTSKIVASQGTGVYAASICSDLVLNGYDDWYLPSRGEVEAIDAAGLNIGISGDGQGPLWTSTELNSNEAYSGSDPHKDYKWRVRAVRSF